MHLPLALVALGRRSHDVHDQPQHVEYDVFSIPAEPNKEMVYAVQITVPTA
jgi:hypothetical protein